MTFGIVSKWKLSFLMPYGIILFQRKLVLILKMAYFQASNNTMQYQNNCIVIFLLGFKF